MTYKEIEMHKHWAFLDGVKGFYEGSDTDSMSFKFGGIVWNVIKDELDGERSLIDFIVYGDQQENFIETLKEKVRLEEVRESRVKGYEVFSGWTLKSIEDNHVWLMIGTDYSSNYYPHVIFKHFNRNNQYLL